MGKAEFHELAPPLTSLGWFYAPKAEGVYTSGEAKWGLEGRLRGSRSLLFSLRPKRIRDV